MAVIRDRGLNAIPFGWVVIGLSVLTTVVFSHITQGIGVLVPFIQDDLEVNRAELGLIASGMFGGGIAAALLAGWLVDVMGVRRLQAASLVVAAGVVVLFSQIRSPVHGLLLALLIGVAHSVTFPAYGKAIMDWVTPPPHSRPGDGYQGGQHTRWRHYGCCTRNIFGADLWLAYRRDSRCRGDRHHGRSVLFGLQG